MSEHRSVQYAFKHREKYQKKYTERMTPSKPEPSWLHLGLSEGGKLTNLEGDLILQYELSSAGSFDDIAGRVGAEYWPVLVIKGDFTIMTV